jgi:VPDSG-CTERM motif
MKNKMILAALATGFISCALFSQQAQAVLITGDIAFAGTAAFDTTSLATAKEVKVWSAVTVSSVSGSFTSVALGSAVTMAAPWTFNPSTATPGLWTVGGFTFDLATSTIGSQNASMIDITGAGTLTGNGFDPTVGAWEFTSQSALGRQHSTFSFSSDTVAVPDGGSAVALLGIALVGVEALRRKFKAC